MANIITDFPIHIAPWWWIGVSTYNSDSILENDLNTIKSLEFTGIVTYEPNLIEGVYDNNLAASRTAFLAQLCEEKGMFIMPLLWATDRPASYYNTDLDNPTFRSWMSQHLQKIGAYFKQYRSVIGFVFDDFGTEEHYMNDMAEWDNFVRSNLNFGRPILLEYDDRYDGFTPKRIKENYTATTAYLYYYQNSTCWGTWWIDQFKNNQDINFPAHCLGIVLDSYEGGWTPSKLAVHIERAKQHKFVIFEYYSWRRGDPETSGQLYHHTEWYDDIKELNLGIKSYLNDLKAQYAPPPSPFLPAGFLDYAINVSSSILFLNVVWQWLLRRLREAKGKWKS